MKEYDGSVITGSFDRSELTKVDLSKFKSTVVTSKRVRDKKYNLLDYKGYQPKYRKWVLSD